jgi:hypothetical protein
MKILMTRTLDGNSEALSDFLLHGFRSIEEIEVVEDPRTWYAYKGELSGPDGRTLDSMHGKGFTHCQLVTEDPRVDRNDVEGKIRSNYYDLIIFSRADFYSPYLELVLQCYPKNKIIFIDGRDDPSLVVHTSTIHLLDKGTYFKRELQTNDPNIYPIGFAFPKEKFLPLGSVAKDRVTSDFEPAAPGEFSRNKYIYDTEADYYNGYAKSYFGKTWRRGGNASWDTQRHHEIISSGCVPWWDGVHECPPRTCVQIDKQSIKEAVDLIHSNGLEWFTFGEGLDRYNELLYKIYNHQLTTNTTEHLAKYVLDTHNRHINK